jgi:hypothetical protein
MCACFWISLYTIRVGAVLYLSLGYPHPHVGLVADDVLLSLIFESSSGF